MAGIAESDGKLDDCVAITCLSLVPAVALAFGVVGVVWVNERPQVGIPCIGGTFLVVVLVVVASIYSRAKSGGIIRAGRWRDSHGGFNAGDRWAEAEGAAEADADDTATAWDGEAWDEYGEAVHE